MLRTLVVTAALLLPAVGATTPEPPELPSRHLADPGGDGSPDLLGFGYAIMGDFDFKPFNLILTAQVPFAADVEVRFLWTQLGNGTPWYLVHVAQETQAIAGHDEEFVSATTTWDAEGLQVSVPLPDDFPVWSCAVLAVEVGRFSATGFERSDIAPDGLQHLSDIAETTTCPPLDEAPASTGKASRKSPVAGLPLIAVALFIGLAAARRRR